MIKILSLCASPVEDSSTELLLRRVAGAVAKGVGERSRHTFVRLNDLDITPCQACGESPEPQFCFIDDAMTRLYRAVVDCDCLLFGSPIYFDTVAAQAKTFIDRCNCLRPADFDNRVAGRDFVKRLTRKRPGAILLVGGEQAWFEGARRCIAGFFKWIEVTNEALLTFQSVDFRRAGEVVEHHETLAAADRIGALLAPKIGEHHG